VLKTQVRPELPTHRVPTIHDVEKFFDTLLKPEVVPDYGPAHNGLQVARTSHEPVRRIAAAVDASEAVIRDAAEQGADLLVVHHGLFWSGAAPITGALHRKLGLLFQHDLALYSSHLPLDGHPKFGNSAVLVRALGFEPEASFGAYQGFGIGWQFTVPDLALATLVGRVEETLGSSVHSIPAGPDRLQSVAVVTGAGGSFIAEAARRGIDLLITGEGAHHTFSEAHEHGVNVIYAGHYATETWGVRALVDEVARHWAVETLFLDHPSGL
jgi:dinuclear metal center YbgI/SA1388 family protein